MKMLQIILVVSVIMWYIIDRFKPMWAELKHGKYIESYKRAKGDLPNGMKQLYEYLHKRDIERAEKVAALQGLYRA